MGLGRKKREEEKRKKEENTLPAFCRKGAIRKGNMKVQFTDAHIYNSEGKETQFFKTGEKLELKMNIRASEKTDQLNLSFSITRDDGVYCYGTTALSGLIEQTPLIIDKGNVEVALVIEVNNLLDGKYIVDIGIQNMNEEIYDYIGGGLEFRIKNESRRQIGQVGIVHMSRHWIVGDSVLQPVKLGEYHG